jgi:hypothetical protein
MMVVDTNIIRYLHLTGDRSSQAEQAFRKDPHWAARQKESIPCPTG